MCIPLVGAYQVNDSGRQLCADAYLALRKAGESLKSSAIAIAAPESKLSEQLNGKAPFTFLWRLVQSLPAFEREFRKIRAHRDGDAYVEQSEMVELVNVVRNLDRRIS